MSIRERIRQFFKRRKQLKISVSYVNMATKRKDVKVSAMRMKPPWEKK